ncbi:MAG: nuclear transport factor 2 family protein [Gammaproteobacteria bacterium]|nr:nuclear transport factor 2 family protein [Gammaproteobacteria bacterium]MCW5583778.1 nuclear transport factor 2 family protein [Gammaproteobacteria bacterium]
MVNNDFEKIIETVTLYFKGTYYGDVEMLSKAFHPNAHVTGIISDELFDWSLSDFIVRVTTSTTAANKGEKYDKEIISIDKTKNVAIVKSRVAVGELIFFDYITLLKIDGHWIIRSKSFTN